MSRIRIAADESTGCRLMIEPLGMVYAVDPGACMFFEVSPSRLGEMEIVYWTGGVTVWLYGEVIVFDQDGNEVDRLFS
ncbi:MULTISPECIES: hypothetical protein [unclassified Streptomyces]|uniref:hypothetical protein n=1 Tax=unclassified Streptomyces TaxID=2593676 RepID=UPI002E2829CA|nr:hypothetical protein [Streptomyces sp. NBC_01439]